MSYEVRLHPTVVRFLETLDNEMRARVKKKLKEAAENPFYYLEHYEGKDYYKLRIGDYRALIDVDFNNRILYVRIFDKRGRIYKRN